MYSNNRSSTCFEHSSYSESLFFYQIDAQILYFHTFIVLLYMFRVLAHLHGVNCINTASGIATLFR